MYVKNRAKLLNEIIFFSYLPRYSAFRSFRVYSGYMESRRELADLTRSKVPTMTESTRIETPRQLESTPSDQNFFF